MKPRTTVYVAMNGLVKVADGINYRQERVTLASDPAVTKYPDAWRELGTVDDAGAAYIVMLGDAAVLPRLWERIAPPGIEQTSGSPAPTPDEQDGDLPGRLSWARIDATYRRLADAPPGWRHRRRRPKEPSRPEVADELHVSTPTLKRACVAAGQGSKWPPGGF
jgi:hypothetical protein